MIDQDRLKERVKRKLAKQVTQMDFAKGSEVENAHFSRWLNSSEKRVKESTALKIKIFLEKL